MDGERKSFLEETTMGLVRGKIIVLSTRNGGYWSEDAKKLVIAVLKFYKTISFILGCRHFIVRLKLIYGIGEKFLPGTST